MTIIIPACTTGQVHEQAAYHGEPSLPPPVNLRCEYRTDPFDIEAAHPRLYWTLESRDRGCRQKAYHVLVSSSAGLLASGIGDLWDSGRVESGASVHVEYGGEPLVSGMRCFWKARVFDELGQSSP